MLPVLSSANVAKRILFQVTNIDQFHVLHVLPVVLAKRAVLNAPIAHPAHLNTMRPVLPAPLALHKVVLIKQRATYATKAPKPKQAVPLPVKIVMWENSTIKKVQCVWIAQPVGTKIPKGKKRVLTVVQVGKYPTKNVLGANCHRGVPASRVNI